MARDPEKARARAKRYHERQKIAKYGPDAAGRDMRGRHGHHARGAANGQWKGGRFVTSHGYVAVRVEPTHPNAWRHESWPAHVAYTYEHILVMTAHLGRPLADDETVHHVNGDKTDNRVENLELLTRSVHASEHDAIRGRDALGRFPPADLRVSEVPRG